jgi:hypothetical protein
MPDATALDAALRKAAVVWLGVDDRRPFPVWPLWHDATVYVLHGGAEQAAPALAAATRLTVTVPAKGAREVLLEFAAEARAVPAGSDEWERLVPLLLPKRLNLRDAAGAAQRWALECSLTAITPVQPH